MGNLGLDMDDKDDVSSDLKSAPTGCTELMIMILSYNYNGAHGNK